MVKNYIKNFKQGTNTFTFLESMESNLLYIQIIKSLWPKYINYTDISPSLSCTNNKILLFNNSRGLGITKVLKKLLKLYRLLAAMTFPEFINLVLEYYRFWVMVPFVKYE